MKKTANALFLLCFLGALAAVPLWTALRPTSGLSFYENRPLAARPSLAAEDLLSGVTFSQLDTYLADHLAWRDGLLMVNTWADIHLYRRPVVSELADADGVLVNFHGYGRWDIGYLQAQADEMGARLGALGEQIAAYGGYFCYLGVPQQYSYFAARYPDYMDNRQWLLSVVRDHFAEALRRGGVPLIEMADHYAALGSPAAFFSAVDHHYTYRGMLAAYTALMERIVADTGLPLTILSESDLVVTPLPNRYLGSRTRKLYGLWPSDEKLEIGTLVKEISFTRFDNGVEVPAALYTLPPEGEPVTFTAYMGGDIAETVIRTDRPELPSVLLFGDSFTNPLETILWASFDETRSLDLRHYTARALSDYIAEYRPDVVICLRDDSAYLLKDGNGRVE